MLLDASAQHAGRTGREILTLAQRTMGLPSRRVDEMLDLVSLTADGGRPPGPRLLARHAPAARHRHRADRRPRGADPRRAGQRPRPGRHPVDARPAARLRRPGRHRAALLAPAARDRGHRRRPGRDRQRPDRRRRAPSASCSQAAGTVVRAAGDRAVLGRRPRGRRHPPSTRRHRRRLRTDADPDQVGTVALAAGVPARPSCGRPTAPGSRRCSSSSPPRPSATQRHADAA